MPLFFFLILIIGFLSNSSLEVEKQRAALHSGPVTDRNSHGHPHMRIVDVDFLVSGPRLLHAYAELDWGRRGGGQRHTELHSGAEQGSRVELKRPSTGLITLNIGSLTVVVLSNRGDRWSATVARAKGIAPILICGRATFKVGHSKHPHKLRSRKHCKAIAKPGCGRRGDDKLAESVGASVLINSCPTSDGGVRGADRRGINAATAGIGDLSAQWVDRKGVIDCPIASAGSHARAAYVKDLHGRRVDCSGHGGSSGCS